MKLAVLTIFLSAAFVTAAPATQATKFRTDAEVVHAVPADLYPKTLAGFTDLKLDAINDALKENVTGHPGIFTLKVNRIERSAASDERRGDWVLIGEMSYVGRLPCDHWFYFDDKDKGKLASLEKGAVVSVSGTIQPARIIRRDGTVMIVVDMAHCQITNHARSS